MVELAGDPGWTGPCVVLLRFDVDDGPSGVVARVTLDDAGQAQVDDGRLRARWTSEGVVGRHEMGRVFPGDGQAFLDELPFVYRGAYLRAVPEDEFFGAVQ